MWAASVVHLAVVAAQEYAQPGKGQDGWIRCRIRYAVWCSRSLPIAVVSVVVVPTAAE
jgi:hypothetical protein